MNLQTKRIKELFGYARTLTREQGLAPMLGRAAGFSGGGCWANARGTGRPNARWRPSARRIRPPSRSSAS